ncbi:hypothetical protein GALMADRAFT_259718 [Galerina marginata CBS 339.88]|uniref:Uncharacterized protein n=1 Tax=Galerina marginata (strain CBS 339.88) TaxID=685588 RepID=A0A067SEN3_GALM3|nr:hypothetical protein GALMADRAFT_259718 [Galerina marginata CBS 339.88]
MYSVALNDIQALSLIISLIILMHAVQKQAIASTPPNATTWSRLISSFLEHQQGLGEEKISTLIPQVAKVAQDIQEDRKFLPRVIFPTWQFSDKEANIFAMKLMQCTNDNLI